LKKGKHGLFTLPEEKEDEFYYKILGRGYVKRAAANAWLSNYDQAVDDFTKAITEYKGIFTEKEIEMI
jgi:hypothetical protein